MNRSDFLKNTFAAALAAALPAELLAAKTRQTATTATTASNGTDTPIDREALVRRHNVTLQALSPKEIAQVGNGEIAFGIDSTGLQTFHGLTLAQWSWHSVPPPAPNPHATFKLTPMDFHGRPLPYRRGSVGKDPLQKQLHGYLRENPHRFNLGRLRFLLKKKDGTLAAPADIKNITQTLDLWTGILSSEYTFDGVPVHVETCCEPASGALAVRIETALIENGRLQIEWSFPYGHHGNQAGLWNLPEKHKTTFSLSDGSDNKAATNISAKREMDDVSHDAKLQFSAPVTSEKTAPHTIVLTPQKDTPKIQFTCFYDLTADAQKRGVKRALPRDVSHAFLASEKHWKHFWLSGGAIDLSQSTDPRWTELERRIVLSQYLLAVNEAGSLPPQESGLYNNSGWNGKFHLEMHFWHAAHYALWNRWELFSPSLKFYKDALPAAKQLAKTQGFKGARYPKMVGPDAEDSPSGTGPVLIWQQPHPIFYAELEYRANPSKEVLEKWREIIHEAALFMEDFAFYDTATKRYVLGPPIATVPENSNYAKTQNPTFELCYWRVGLRLAQTWRERLGQNRVKSWDEIIKNLAELPQDEGVYLQQEGMLDTFTKMNWEHPSLIGPHGVLPADGADKNVTRRTVEKVWKTWKWQRCWGWDFPMFAMAAAKNELPELAVKALLHPSSKNSMNRLGLSSSPFPYFPSNGALLYAVAMMCAGWDGRTDGRTKNKKINAPGFPQDGKWKVRWENLAVAP
jgi:hypothetical protein